MKMKTEKKVNDLLESGLSLEQAREALGFSKGYFRDVCKGLKAAQRLSRIETERYNNLVAILHPHNTKQPEEREMEWKPIETAPKDWTDILLYLPDEDDGTNSQGVVKGWFSMEDGGFNCWMSYEANSGQCYPTHWMPLPTPPKP